MVARRIFGIALAVAFALLTTVRPVKGGVWSLPKLTHSNKRAPTKPTPHVQKKEPSAWEKLNAGTKKFFTNLGNALTLKKSPPKRQRTLPYNSWIKPPKEEPKPNWFTALFQKKEQRPQKPSDWIGQPRPSP